jgi:translation elongation factor EF-G
MPVASATAEISFSVLRRLKTYVRSTTKNDRLSSLGLMHINRDFEVDLYKAMKVFVSAKTRHQLICLQHGAVDAVHGSGFPI